MCAPLATSGSWVSAPSARATRIVRIWLPFSARKMMAAPSAVQRRKWPPAPTEVSCRCPSPWASMTHTSSRPLRSDRKAIERPSGEGNGLVSSDRSSVSRTRLPSATATRQMSALPPRAEKKTRSRPSGDPGGLVVAARAAGHLALRAALQLAHPDIHFSHAIRVERDPAPVGRPRAPALHSGRGEQRRGLAGGLAGLRRDRQPPEVGVDAAHREDHPPSVRCDRRLHVVAGTGGHLFGGPVGVTIGAHRNTPEVESATAVGRQVNPPPIRRPGRIDVEHVVGRHRRTRLPVPGSAMATSAPLLSWRRKTRRCPSGDHRAWA